MMVALAGPQVLAEVVFAAVVQTLEASKAHHCALATAAAASALRLPALAENFC